MGKIRPQFEALPAIGLAQWVGRKLVNHDPMREMDGNQSRKDYRAPSKTRVVKDGEPKPGVVYCGIVAGQPTKVRYGLIDGRVFEIEVRDISATIDAEPVELQAVGL